VSFYYVSIISISHIILFFIDLYFNFLDFIIDIACINPPLINPPPIRFPTKSGLKLLIILSSTLKTLCVSYIKIRVVSNAR